jgi:hypothetical protein
MHRLEDWLGLTLNGFLLAGLIELLRYDEHARGHYLDEATLPSKSHHQPLEGPFTPQALRLLDPDDAAPLFRLAAVQTDDELNQTWIGRALKDRQVALLRGAHLTAQDTFGIHGREFLDWTRCRFLLDWNGDKKKGPGARPLADWPESPRLSFLKKLEATRTAIPYKAAQWHRKKRAFYETLWESDSIHWEDNLGIGAPLYDPQTEGFSDLGQSIRQFNAYARGLGKPGLWLFADYSDFCEPNTWLST